MQIYPKRPYRLDDEIYEDVNRVFLVTSCLRGSYFSEIPVVTAAVDVLLAHAARRNVPLYAFSLMPDHVHLVLSPSDRIDLKRFVGEFKNLAQRARWGLGHRGLIWQTSFRDDLVRADDTMTRYVRYTMFNPVAEGLASAWDEYPFSGSNVFSADEISEMMIAPI